jgi:hypothetical protein|tara:strand:+ start:270 stop:476 length:207 start_codon:yes stop_codon:yes gene_type:complete
MLYSAQGQLINKDMSKQVSVNKSPKKIEYKANGNLVIEEADKETVKAAVKIPGDQVFFPFSSKSTEEE